MSIMNLFKKKKEDPRLGAARNMANVYAKYETPEVAERIYELVDLAQVGQLTPDQEQELLQAATEFENIQVDPQYRENMIASMQARKEQATDPVNAAERAAMADITRQQAQGSSRARQAAMQNMASRNMGGSGQELAAQLAGNQAAAGEANSRFSNLMGSIGNRMSQAVTGYAEDAGNVRKQDYDTAFNRATAQDLINKFNVGSRSDIQERNVAATNQAAKSNLTEAQRISNINQDKNTARSKMERDARLGYEQDELDRRLGAAGKDVNTSGVEWDKNEDRKKANAISGAVGTAGSLIKTFMG